MALPNPRVAARRALADYLRTNLTAAWPNIVVSENWPTPQAKLAPQALTVLAPQSGEFVEYHQPVVWQVTPATNTAGSILYSYGKMTLPLQVDAWAQFEAVRDDLVAAVLPLLNRDTAATLGVSQTATLAQAPGLVIPVPTYANVTAEYHFDPLPRLWEDQEPAMVSDWRATWVGDATIYLVQQETQPLMLDVTVKLSANGAAAEDVFPYSYEGQVLEDAPALYWRLGDAASSATAADISGNSFTGAAAGVTFGSTGLLTGDRGTAAAASGTASVTESADLGVSSAFTAEWWVRPTALTAGGNDVGQSTTTFKVAQNADGSLSVSVGGASFSVPGALAVGKTSHLALTFDGTTSRFYVNGQLAASAATPAPSGGVNAFGVCKVGPWQGSFQEVAVYRAALPASRVLSHYYLGSIGP